MLDKHADAIHAMSPTDPDDTVDPRARVARPTEGDGAPKSFGNMSPDHWSRARAGANAEALEYYRARSHAPGVEGGGGSRNFYCMRCDGVIAFDHADARCPHCGETLSGESKRYFNWVEINEPAKSDFKALLPVLVAAAIVLGLVGVAAIAFFL